MQMAKETYANAKLSFENDFYIFTREEAKEQLGTALEMLEEVEKYLKT